MCPILECSPVCSSFQKVVNFLKVVPWAFQTYVAALNLKDSRSIPIFLRVEPSIWEACTIAYSVFKTVSIIHKLTLHTAAWLYECICIMYYECIYPATSSFVSFCSSFARFFLIDMIHLKWFSCITCWNSNKSFH